MAFSISPLYGQGGTYSAQQDRLGIQAYAVTGGVRKLTNASAGAMTGDLAVTTTGVANASVNIASGQIVIPWTSASNQGYYLALNDASTVVGTFSANSSGSNRIDLVSVLITDTGSGAPTVTFVITAGTTSPPATPANSVALAQVTLPNGFTTGTGVGAGNIVDVRTKAFLPDLSSNSTINALGTTLSNVPSPVSGNLVYSDLGDQLVAYNGSSWDGLPQNAGHRNALINGQFNVDQRNAGASKTFTAGSAAVAFGIDRWYTTCTGANISAQQVAGSAPDQYYYQFTGAASNTAIGFGQRIEALNCFHFAGTQATLSVKLKSSSLTAVTWTAYYANTTDAWGTVASPTKTSISSGTFTITSTMARYQATFAVPLAATTGIEIVFTTGALLATQTLTFGAAQFEVGSVATPIERRNYAAELVMCQRYCLRLTGLYVCTAWAWGSGSAYGVYMMPVVMRGNATVVASSSYSAYYGLLSTTTLGTVNAVGSKSTILFQCGGGSGMTAGNATFLQDNGVTIADSEMYI